MYPPSRALPSRIGPGETDRPAERDEADQGDGTEDTQRPEEAVVMLPGLFRTSGPPPPDPSRDEQCHSHDRKERPEVGLGGEPDHGEVSVVDDHQVGEVQRLLQDREPEHHCVEHEEDDEQWGDVANDLYVEPGGLGHQPVGGETGHSNQHPDQGEQRDAHDHQGQGVLDRVEQPPPDRSRRADVGAGDVHPEWLGEEIEAGGEPGGTQVVGQVEPEHVEDDQHSRPGQHLDHGA